MAGFRKYSTMKKKWDKATKLYNDANALLDKDGGGEMADGNRRLPGSGPHPVRAPDTVDVLSGDGVINWNSLRQQIKRPMGNRTCRLPTSSCRPKRSCRIISAHSA